MSHDRQARRTLGVLVCVVFLAVTAGCRRSPFQRLADSPIADRPPSTRPAESQATPVEPPANVPPSIPVATPPLPLAPPQADLFPSTPIPPSSETSAAGDQTAAVISPAATPLLDAALRRAEAVERSRKEVAAPVQPSAVPADPPIVRQVSTVTPAVLAPNPGPKPPLITDLLEAPKPTSEPEPKPEPKPPVQPTAEKEPADPAVTWKKNLERLKQIATESANRPEMGDQAALWQVRAQVVDWLSSSEAGPADFSLLKSAVDTLAEAITVPSMDDSTRSAEIRSALQALEDRVPLGITELRLCRKVMGFGTFEPLDGHSLKLGQPVLIYCELTGLRFESREDGYHSRLSSRVELISDDDGTQVWNQTLGNAEDHCLRRRRDFYVNYRLDLPATLTPGSYRLRLTQTDLIADHSTSSEAPVTITP